MTERLYYESSYEKEFTAKVTGCEKNGERYEVTLDRTAFFPEGGGQLSDSGYLDGARVFEVQESKNDIIHYTDSPLEVGSAVTGKLDWDIRFRRMQNHTGEHIVSGTVHSLFGYDNVGFNLGNDIVTVDFNGVLTKDDIRKVEYIANKAVADNLSVTAEFPDEMTLEKLDYRSKLELKENVRIVTIDGVDVCACCAPHVGRTGEIGIIKLLDFEKYKGGVRCRMLCGFDALNDYNKKYDNILAISGMLSAKQHETAAAVKRVTEELEREKSENLRLKKMLVNASFKDVSETDGNILGVADSLDMNTLRIFVNGTMPKCKGYAAAFSGNDDDGYIYVIGSENVNLRDITKDINTAINGKGGGSPQMICGSAKATLKEIGDYMGAEIIKIC
ncbi:MAG: hypothetical protein K6F09_02615 [Clostridiales bacterium]|nr:hypothetical protein [Clostridiales bacterium]